MTLADYLESKAEYIFDNYRADFYNGIKPEDLKKNREAVIDRLKRGLRKLGEGHDREFWELDEKSKHVDVWFTAWVDAYWAGKHGMNAYFVSLSSPNWSVTKILIEKYGKKFEDLFRVEVVVSPQLYPPYSEFEIDGSFSNDVDPSYTPANFLFSIPTISKLSKYKSLNVLKNINVEGLRYFYDVSWKYSKELKGVFADFILLSPKEDYPKYRAQFSENLLVTDGISKSGIDAIKLNSKEYDAIIAGINIVKLKTQLPDKYISIKDVLSTIVYIKITGNVP